MACSQERAYTIPPRQPMPRRIEDLSVAQMVEAVKLGIVVSQVLLRLINAIDDAAAQVTLTPEVRDFARGFVEEIRVARELYGIEGW